MIWQVTQENNSCKKCKVRSVCLPRAVGVPHHLEIGAVQRQAGRSSSVGSFRRCGSHKGQCQTGSSTGQSCSMLTPEEKRGCNFLSTVAPASARGLLPEHIMYMPYMHTHSLHHIYSYFLVKRYSPVLVTGIRRLLSWTIKALSWSKRHIWMFLTTFKIVKHFLPIIWNNYSIYLIYTFQTLAVKYSCHIT